MKILAAIMVVTVLLLAGCEYEVPLTKEHVIPVESSVLGLWEYIPEEGEGPSDVERMMILEFSDTEALIHYPVDKEGIYFRAYAIKVGGVSCVQIEAIGTIEGPIPQEEKKRYAVMSYELADGILEINILNNELVDGKLKSSEALRKVFLEHQDDEDLFIDPGRFRRVEDSSEQDEAGDGK